MYLKMFCTVERSNAILNVFGGTFFIIGSVYIIPNVPINCFGDGCSLNVAVFYLVGCIFNLIAAVTDFFLRYVIISQRGVRCRRVGFRMNDEVEEVIASFLSFLGAILFFAGTIFFFPSINLPIVARNVFRTGSCIYVMGSLFGIFRITHPVYLESDGKVEDSNRSLLRAKEAITYDCIKEYLANSAVINVSIKVLYISSSICFLMGGIMFDYGGVLFGGYLWLIGSCFYFTGSFVTLCETCVMNSPADASDTESVSTGHSGSTEIDSDNTPIARSVYVENV